MDGWGDGDIYKRLEEHCVPANEVITTKQNLFASVHSKVCLYDLIKLIYLTPARSAPSWADADFSLILIIMLDYW